MVPCPRCSSPTHVVEKWGKVSSNYLRKDVQQCDCCGKKTTLRVIKGK